VTATFQYNDASGSPSTHDGMGYDVDHTTDGVVFQYNLSHDNNGGFFLLCPYGSASATQNFTIRYNISVNDHTRGFESCGNNLTNGQIYNNTIYLDDGVSQQVITPANSGDVHFTNNIVSRHGTTGTVSWPTTATWTIDHNNLYNVPAPSWATNTVTGAPLFAGRTATDPNGYKVVAGSADLGSGTVISSNGGQDFFGNPVSATANPNIGAYQGGQVCSLPLLDTFNTDTAGSAPTGWTLSGATGAFTVAADPAPQSTGNSLLGSTQSTTAYATHGFTATGDLQADVRLRAGQYGSAEGFFLLDTNGGELAKVSLAADGNIAYTNGTNWIDSTSPATYTLNAWHRIQLTVHQGAGTYDLTADGAVVATGIPLNTTGASAATVKLNLPGGSPASFAADDVLVAQLTGC
jgi:hypothetical protein